MKKLACITLDMEPDYGDPDKHIRLLENAQFLERYIKIINKYNAKVTMFTVTNLFEKKGDDFAKLATRIPLEFSVHSHTHDPRNACSLDEVHASQDAYKKFTGNNPPGYRAPIGMIDKRGLGHLLDHGYTSALARIFAARGITDRQQLGTSLSMARRIKEAFRFYKSQDFRKSVEVLHQIDERSLSSTQLYLLGRLYSGINEPEKALYYMNRALENEPSKKEYLYNKGKLLYRMGRLGEALETFNLLEHIDGSYRKVRLFLSKLGKAADDAGQG